MTVSLGDAVTWPATRQGTLTNGATSDVAPVNDDFNAALNAVNALRTALLPKVRNESGGTLTKGTLVYFSGYNASETAYLLTKADADNHAATHVMLADLSNNTTNTGNCVPMGVVSNIDTSAFSAAGDAAYLSATAGAFTNTAPTGAGQVQQDVGRVKSVHATTGAIEFYPGLALNLKVGTGWLQALSITNALIAAGTIDLTTKVTGILPAANGGTASQYVTFTGPTQARTYTLPDAAATLARVGAITTRVAHTWAISGAIAVPSGDTDFICPFYVPVPTGQTAALAACRYSINSGTSATVKLQKNGVDATGFTAISVTTTPATTDPANVALADGDALALVVTAVSASPTNMSFTVWIEYTV